MWWSILYKILFALCLLHQLQVNYVVCSWDHWWTYDGISGPDYWGLLNPKWSHCNKGRRQSPIDINPDLLLYDPRLKPLNIEGTTISGVLQNTGRGLNFQVSSNTTVIVTGGPLSYEYTLDHIGLHYGREDDRGSEHTISGIPFPGELQLYFFNSQLFDNWTQASDQPNGLAAVAILIQLTSQDNGVDGNSELKHIFSAVEAIRFKGTSTSVQKMNVSQLLPTARKYITYDGSLTEPACYETVQWIILNKPIYATAHQISLLRNSIHLEGYGDNFRPTQVTNARCVRTNIANIDNSTEFESIEDSEQNSVNFKRKMCNRSGFFTYKGSRIPDAEDEDEDEDEGGSNVFAQGDEDASEEKKRNLGYEMRMKEEDEDENEDEDDGSETNEKRAATVGGKVKTQEP